MKKSHKFDDLSGDHKCAACNKPIKRRLVESKPSLKFCFTCHVLFEAERNHYILGEHKTHRLMKKVLGGADNE